jgi:hypothetical protein
MQVIVQYYHDKNPERRNELETCLRQNLNNEAVEHVHLLLETETLVSTQYPKDILEHPKCIVGKCTGNERLTFRFALEYAKQNFDSDQLVVILNADIIVGEWDVNKLENIFNLDPQRICLALSRHEINAENDTWCDPNIMTGWSQDCWVFRAPFVADHIVSKMEFCVGGAPACDNYMVYLLRELAGMQVLNMAFQFPVYHFDRCRGHAGGTMVFNTQTDMRAKQAFEALPRDLALRVYLCPFVDYEKFLKTNPDVPLHKGSNCWRRGPHTHDALFEKVDLNHQEYRVQLEKALKAVQRACTQNERQKITALCTEIVEKENLYDPESCLHLTTKGWEFRDQAKWKEAFDQASEALKLDDDPLFLSPREKVARKYDRHKLMSIVAWYVDEKVQGLDALVRAIHAKGLKEDIDNLNFYFPLSLPVSDSPFQMISFWTGENPLTEKRRENIYCLQTVPQVKHVLVMDKDIAKREDLHPAYPFLSQTHKADYLRMHYMHFFGGGYSDIKATTGSWKEAFELLKDSPDHWVNGYQEIGPHGVAHPQFAQHFEDLIGLCAFIFKPNTPLTCAWRDQVHRLLDQKFPLLKLNPAQNPQDCAENDPQKYPIEWNEMLGRILHPLLYHFKDRILKTVPSCIFENYR